MAFLNAATLTGSLISTKTRRIMLGSPLSFPAMLACIIRSRDTTEKVEGMPGLLRQFPHEGSLCPAIALSERMHAVEINQDIGSTASEFLAGQIHTDVYPEAVFERCDRVPEECAHLP